MKHALVLLTAAFVAALGNTSWAVGGHVAELELEDASVIIETNCTDADSGIQMFIDGEGWNQLFIFGPNWQFLGILRAKRGLGEVGLTELFFEGEEPVLEYPLVLGCESEDEEPDGTLEEFLENYPEGTYRFFTRTVEGDRQVGEAELTHDIPAGPEIILPAEDVEQNPDNVVIMWDSSAQPEGIEIVSQQVIVEIEDESVDFLRVLDIQLSVGTTMFTVPPEFFDSIDGLSEEAEIKVEVLVKEASGNQTITEREFELMD